MFSKIIINFVLLILPQIVFAQNIESLYWDQSYWKNFDWSKVEESLLWSDAKFKGQPIEPDEKTISTLQSQTIVIEGINYHATIMKIKKDNFPYQAAIAPHKELKDSCDFLNKKLTKAFGNSSEMADNSNYMFEESRSFQYDWQWEVGNTRITLNCGSIGKSADKNEFVTVRYEHLDESTKIEAPIHLTCPFKTQTYTQGSQRDWQNSNQPFDITILPHLRMVTNAHGQVIAMNVKIGDSLINFNYKLSQADIDISINRLNGFISGDGKNIKYPNIKHKLEGNCLLRDPKLKKF